MLGDGMIDLDLDPIHYETALDRALTRYRQRSPNAVEESYSFLELIQDQNEYRLPDEIIEVRQVFRRAIGSRTGMGAGGTLRGGGATGGISCRTGCACTLETKCSVALNT